MHLCEKEGIYGASNERTIENLLNLHDAFLNASLQRDRIDNEPLDERHNKDLEILITDRFRFERTWLAFLFVLVECWRSEMMMEVREIITGLVTDSSIENLIFRRGRERLY